jgi:hypothetical protein
MLLSPILFLENLALLIATRIYFIAPPPFPPAPTLGAGSFPVCPQASIVVPGPLPDGSQAVLAYHALLAWPKTPTRKKEEEEATSQGRGRALAQQDEQRTSNSKRSHGGPMYLLHE